jgi:cytochrome c-type biogenesis protein CcmE
MLRALNDKLVFYYTPAAVPAGYRADGRAFRLGGLVAKGSLQSSPDRQTYVFVVTDYHARVGVRYRGLLPDLFREGQGVVADGNFDPASGIFMARTVLAKHDEKYVPPAVPHTPAHRARLQGRAERLEAFGKALQP